MKFKLLSVLLLLGSINLIAGQELRKEYITDSCTMQTIEYSNHTYIRFHNGWNSAGDFMFHDPDCRCRKENSLTPQQAMLLLQNKK